MFSCEFCEIFNNIFFTEHLWATASDTPKTTTNINLDEKQRKCKIIWFNPPYLVNVKTSNIVKIFLSLLKKYFSKTNKLHKIFNKNNIKISYSCMSHISSIIAGHNKLLLQPKITEYGCNCGVNNSCPLQNQCQTRNVIYGAEVENDANDQTKIYFDLPAATLKKRFGNHKNGLSHRQRNKNTALSKYIWSLKKCRYNIQY